MHAVGRRRRACRAACPSDEHGAMLPRLADLRAERAAWAVCKKAGGMANAGTRQAASTLASRLAPRHPRQACRPTYDSLHACVPRQLKAEPGEAAALAQPRHIARPRQQLGNPTRRSECSRPISWSADRRRPVGRRRVNLAASDDLTRPPARSLQTEQHSLSQSSDRTFRVFGQNKSRYTALATFVV